MTEAAEGSNDEAAERATQRVRHCAGVDVGRRLAEVDDLSECGRGHGATAEELLTAPGRARSSRSEILETPAESAPG